MRQPSQLSVVHSEPDFSAQMSSLLAAMERNTEAITSLTSDVANAGRFIQKWTGWIIAAIAVAYPTVGKIISSLPPLP